MTVVAVRPELPGPVVGPDEQGDQAADVEAVPGLDLEPGQDAAGGPLALDVVAAGGHGHPAALVLPAGRRRLAQVVVERGQEQGQPLRRRPVRPVRPRAAAWSTRELGVGPDRVVAEGVRLGMEDRVLDDQGQGLELGEPLVEDAEAEHLLEADRRPRRVEEDLEHLVVDPLDAEAGEVDGPGGRVDGRVDLEAQDRGEAGHPEDPQGVVGEGGRVGQADALGQGVLAALERVDERPVLEAEGHAVGPEIAALEVLLDRQVGVGGDQDVLVAADARGAGPVGPRQGDVVGPAPDRELDDAEALADEVDAAVLFELADDRLEGVAGDEEVDLGGRAAADEVADEAADGVDVAPEKPDEERPVGEVEARAWSFGGRGTSPGPP